MFPEDWGGGAQRRSSLVYKIHTYIVNSRLSHDVINLRNFFQCLQSGLFYITNELYIEGLCCVCLVCGEVQHS